MERLTVVNPKRIQWCCADFGITTSKLASDLGISNKGMQQTLAGHEGITFNQLQKIADYFGRGVLFFVDPSDVKTEQAHSPQFRTLATQKPKLSAQVKTLIKRAEAQRDVYLSLQEDLEESETPPFQPPKLPTNNVTRAARLTRDWLGLGEKNDFDSFRAAVEAKGILVFRSTGYRGKWQIDKDNPIMGFALYHPVCPVLVVRKEKWESRQAFTLMHELAHVLLHKTSVIDNEQDLISREGQEHEANVFAGHVLVPDEFLAIINDEDRPDYPSEFNDWLNKPRRTWGVSNDAILLRLVDAGRLPANAYDEYREWAEHQSFPVKEGGNRQYRHREPLHLFGSEFVRHVLDALGERHITLVKASHYLDGLKLTDLHKLKDYMYAPHL